MQGKARTRRWAQSVRIAAQQREQPQRAGVQEDCQGLKVQVAPFETKARRPVAPARRSSCGGARTNRNELILSATRRPVVNLRGKHMPRLPVCLPRSEQLSDK